MNRFVTILALIAISVGFLAIFGNAVVTTTLWYRALWGWRDSNATLTATPVTGTLDATTETFLPPLRWEEHTIPLPFPAMLISDGDTLAKSEQAALAVKPLTPLRDTLLTTENQTERCTSLQALTGLTEPCVSEFSFYLSLLSITPTNLSFFSPTIDKQTATVLLGIKQALAATTMETLQTDNLESILITPDQYHTAAVLVFPHTGSPFTLLTAGINKASLHAILRGIR